MATPIIFPAAKQILGFNREAVQGVPVTSTPAFTTPFDTWSPEFVPTWLDDKALRAAMGDTYGRQQGPVHETVSWGGPVFLDQLPLFLNNILGDITSTGTLPVSHACSLLNSGGGQPGSLTLFAWEGMPATTGSRTYPGVCLSELTITGNADSTLLMYSAKGLAYASADLPTTPAVYTPTTVAPLAAWRFALGIGGTAAGAPNKTIRDFSFTIARALRVENTFQNSQNPFIIARGPISMTGSATCTVPGDESYVNYLINNTQPQLNLAADVGAGATNFGITINANQTAFDTTKLNNSEEVLGYDGTFVMIDNVTDVGASGGFSPCKITVRNQTASGSY